MKTIFLAYSFRPEDRDLASHIERLLASHAIRVTTGERLGGEQLTDAVRNRIEQADGLIALVTRREQKVGGGWTTHQWVLDELNHARANRKRAIALVDNVVDVGGMYQSHERIPYDPNNPLLAILALSETVDLWKRDAGRLLKVQILPESVAQRLENGSRCTYRFLRDGRWLVWQDGIAVQEIGGTFVYVNGVHDDVMIQLRVEHQGKIWLSRATSQWMPVELREQRG